MKAIRATITIGAAAVALLGALSHPAAASTAQEQQVECVQDDPTHWLCTAEGECTLQGVHNQCAAIAYLTGLTLELYACVDGVHATCQFGDH